MRKRLISFVLVSILLLGVYPCSVFATDMVQEPEIIMFDDGSSVEIFIERTSPRVANTVSGTKNLVFRDSDGDVRWHAKLTATFAYSGAWYTCTTANCNVTINDSTHWYVISNTTTRSSNNAITNLTMGRRYLGATVERPQYTIKLTCDSNGNLS